MRGKITGQAPGFRRLALSALVLSCLCWLETLALRAESQSAGHSKAGLLRHGRFVYERNCATCHGPRGDGQGEMATEIHPKPRSFVSGVFKYKSTPRASLPLEEDLYRTIRSGVAGTSMPAFSQLSESDLQGVVEYIKSFSKVWKGNPQKPVPIDLPPIPDWFGDSKSRNAAYEKGARLIQQNCAPCHDHNASETSGISPTLQDAWGQPSPAPNLKTSTPRISRATIDLYRLLREGIAGTPMPGYAESLSQDQFWELIVWLQEADKPQNLQTKDKGSPQAP